jgi:hypothetical protein
MPRAHFDYYDDGLGAVVTSKAHEKRLMKKQGLKDYRDTKFYEARRKGFKGPFKPEFKKDDALGEKMADFVMDGIKNNVNTREKQEKWVAEKKKTQPKPSQSQLIPA